MKNYALKFTQQASGDTKVWYAEVQPNKGANLQSSADRTCAFDYVSDKPAELRLELIHAKTVDLAVKAASRLVHKGTKVEQFP